MLEEMLDGSIKSIESYLTMNLALDNCPPLIVFFLAISKIMQFIEY
jgi:hypothetical protein